MNLSEWEHRPEIIKVLTSYEMGAWLHRRDGRVLQEIIEEIDAHREELKILADDDWYSGKIRGYDCAVEIILRYKGDRRDKG